MALQNYIVELAIDRLCGEVLVNDWPVARNFDPAGRLTNVKISPWLLEGDNVIQIRLAPALEPAPARDPEDAYVPDEGCKVGLFKLEGDTRPRDVAPILFYRWSADEYPLSKDGMTTVFEHRFTMTKAFGPFRWTDAIVYAETDRPAIMALVERLHGALAAGDRDALTQLLRVRLEEYGRCAGLTFDEMVDDQNIFFDELFADGISVPPFDPENLVLRSGAGGRLVQVERDGGDLRALRFLSAAGVAAALPICVSNLGGTWTVVR